MATGTWNFLRLFQAAALALCAGNLSAQEDLLDACEQVWPWRPLSGHPTPSLKAVLTDSPVSGKALEVRFAASEQPQFVGRALEGAPSWNEAAGLSFLFKGDGSSHSIAVTLLDETLTRRYATLVSLASKDWQRVTRHWEEFVPELVSSEWLGSGEGAFRPAAIRALWLGRWYYLRPWPGSTFQLDDLRLERRIGRPAVQNTATLPTGLSKTLAKLKRREPVTIVALGDSITCGTNLEAPDKQAYPAILQECLRVHFGYERIEVFNRGVGGLETRQGIIRIPLDVTPFRPDLVLAQFGYNDLSSMQGKSLSLQQEAQIAQDNFRELVRHLRSAAGPQCEILLIAPIPGANDGHREALVRFGQVAGTVAREEQVAFTEVPGRAFQESWRSGKLEELFLRLPNGNLDVAHPNERGQRLIAESLLQAFKE